MDETPKSNRIHIALFGKRNSGKSSLINALTGQQAALVSDVPGTTTDPVYKPMEVAGVGPCVFIDTAGFDDEGRLGELRIQETQKVLAKTDLALLLCTNENVAEELRWMQLFKDKNVPFVLILNKQDLLANVRITSELIERKFHKKPLEISTITGEGVEDVRKAIIEIHSLSVEQPDILGDLVKEGDVVMLVMPQDAQAPKGRLILPQVQALRELLDKRCVAVSCTPDKMDHSLSVLASAPSLIITDSQVFNLVYEKKPASSRLTSFSVLFARQKGDIGYFVESASMIDRLDQSSQVLIAEACTHAPLSEDIGRVKIPTLLRKRVGEGLKIDWVAGNDFPVDLTPYSLVIHCGACMFNRKHVLDRVAQAKRQGVPMTNYGIVIAYLNEILQKVEY